jgi:phenylacetic acid degradation operon negative regulatory protein
MSSRAAAETLIDEFRSRPTLRAGSLITTVFGDAIAPRGGAVWIGSLIDVMAGFGVSERLVRTSVFRLAADGWLEAQPIGRRSYYGLTGDGAQRFEHATQRIYGEPRRSWSGAWCLVLLGGVSAASRDEIRRQLGWLGFGAISPSVLAHPAPDDEEVRFLLERHEVAADAVVLTGRSAGVLQDQQLRTLAKKSWNLDELDRRFAGFVVQFAPVRDAVANAGDVDPLHAFQIRTLLIQEYRKILLRDPQLPADLLPDDWHGLEAYRLCRSLYRSVFAAADDFLAAAISTPDGPLPLPGDDYYRRFGGLKPEYNDEQQ